MAVPPPPRGLSFPSFNWTCLSLTDIFASLFSTVNCLLPPYLSGSKLEPNFVSKEELYSLDFMPPLLPTSLLEYLEVEYVDFSSFSVDLGV